MCVERQPRRCVNHGTIGQGDRRLMIEAPISCRRAELAKFFVFRGDLGQPKRDRMSVLLPSRVFITTHPPLAREISFEGE